MLLRAFCVVSTLGEFPVHADPKVPSVGEHLEPITGPITATEEPDGVAQVPLHDAYFTAAEAFMRGALLLADAPPSDAAPALALLSGQILECSLKAFLAKAGEMEDELRQKAFRHNVLALWKRAETKGLRIGAIPPQWAVTLDSLHNKPYYLRYASGLHGWVLPNAQQMMSDLKHLVETVRQRILQDGPMG
jgi:hypothetical protein